MRYFEGAGTTKDQIYVTRKERNFTQIENVTIRDTNLSLAAKGLLTLLISFADGDNMVTQITTRQLAEHTKESKSSIANILKELIDQHFVERSQHFTQDPETGQNRYSTVRYYVYETRELYRNAMDRARLKLGILPINSKTEL